MTASSDCVTPSPTEVDHPLTSNANSARMSSTSLYSLAPHRRSQAIAAGPPRNRDRRNRQEQQHQQHRQPSLHRSPSRAFTSSYASSAGSPHSTTYSQLNNAQGQSDGSSGGQDGMGATGNITVDLTNWNADSPIPLEKKRVFWQGANDYLYDDPRSPYFHNTGISSSTISSGGPGWAPDNRSRGRQVKARGITIDGSSGSHSGSRPLSSLANSFETPPQSPYHVSNSASESPTRPSTSSSPAGDGGSPFPQQQPSQSQWFRYHPPSVAGSYGSTVGSEGRRGNSREPDRYVRAVITQNINGSSNILRKGSAGRHGTWAAAVLGGGSGNVGRTGGAGGPGSCGGVPPLGMENRPMRIKAFAKRNVPGTGEYVVAGNDSLRILRLRKPALPRSSSVHSSYSISEDQQAANSPPPPPTSLRTEKGGPLSYKTPPRPLATGVGGTSIEELIDLWQGVPSGSVGHVVNDVIWGCGPLWNKVLTACANGNFMVFDVQKGKFDFQSTGGHSRSMLALRSSKIPSHGRTVVTGGADGFAKLWDIRIGSNKSAVMSIRHPCPITSICFCPPELENSAATDGYLIGLENGSIFRYDIRKGSRSVGRLTAAHGSKAVMDLVWKSGDPEMKGDDDGNLTGSAGWLASAGLDKTVKIWDMSSPEMLNRPYHVIHAPHPVRRIMWRPEHPTEIAVVSIRDSLVSASSAGMQANAHTDVLTDDEDTGLINDDEESRLEIWDVRRGFVPKYVLGTAARFGNSGIIMDLAWEDKDTLATCHSNGSFVLHDARRHFRPLDTLPRQALSWNAQGDLTLAVDRFMAGEVPFDDIKPELANSLEKIGVKGKMIQDPPYLPLQSSQTISLPFESSEAFKHLAQEYKYGGRNAAPIDICEWNAKVAREAGKTMHLQFWLLLRDLIEDQTAMAPGKTACSTDVAAINDVDIFTRRGSNVSARTFQNMLATKSLTPDLKSTNIRRERRGSDSSSASSSSSDSKPSPQLMQHSPRMLKGIENGDYFGGGSPSTLMAGSPLTHGRGSSLQNRLTAATFESRPGTPKQPLLSQSRGDKIAGNSSSSEDQGQTGMTVGKKTNITRLTHRGHQSGSDGGSTARASPVLLPAGSQMDGAQSLPPLDGTPFGNSSLVPDLGNEGAEYWIAFRLQAFREAVWDLVDGGEVQLTASLVAVAQMAGMDNLDDLADRLYEAYMELLERCQLLPASACFRNQVAALQPLTLNETTIYTRCTRCRKATTTPEHGAIGTEWFCKSCKRAISICVVCQLPVKTLLITCAACGHGGHQSCIKEYYDTLQEEYGLQKPVRDWLWTRCLSGCGCRCWHDSE